MELDPKLVAVLAVVIGWVVAEGLQQLSRLVKKDLSGQQAALTAAIVGLIVATANGFLAMVPPEYAVYVNGLMAFLVIVLGPMALHSFINKFSNSVKG